MLRFGLPVLAFIVLIVSGWAHGHRSDRGGPRPDVISAAESLKTIPTVIGSWYSNEVPISERELAAAGAAGHVSRKYINRDNGNAVNVMMLCGRHGPISVHPPTACFVGSGWKLKSSPKKYSIQSEQSSQKHEFWLADFQRSSPGVKYTMRTFWAWTHTGEWQAADHPRVQYASSPYLYKLYVTYLLEGQDEPVDGSAGVEFAKILLEEIDSSVFDRDGN